MAAAVIVAAGSGRRMGGDRKKQYLLLSGRPILAHTLEAFDRAPAVERVVLVVPAADLEEVRSGVLPLFGGHTPVELVAGGERRQDSVRNGLAALGPETGIVLIHDGVRPFVSAKNIEDCVSAAKEHGAAVLAVPASDTLKAVGEDGVVRKTLDRSRVWLAQTPQAFELELIRKAHSKALAEGLSVTDDAALAEHLGIGVRVVPGSRANIKITTPEDLDMARAILAVQTGLADRQRP